jgi:hypothetical protein
MIMKQAVMVSMFFPAVAFCVAALLEFRPGRERSTNLVAMAVVALGLADFGLLWDPWGLVRLTPDASIWLSRAMTLLSASIGCSGVFMPYSRRASGVLVACGGLALTCFWMFNRVVA